MKTDKNGQTASVAKEVSASKHRLQTSDFFWLVGCFAVAVVAAFLRFWQLALKPLHHDEGVNGYFLVTLFRDGIYKYDPSNYHGPTLYYISLFFTKIFGLETFWIRASVGVFGVLTVVAIFFLRRYLGTIGALAAALFVALSPGMVYISRYFIHEIFFVFCSLGIVLGVLFFIEGRKPGALALACTALILLVCFLPPVFTLANVVADGEPTLEWILRVAFFAVEVALCFFILRMLLNWNDGAPIYLLLASASMSLFFATKETAFITIGTMLIACLCVRMWCRIFGGARGEMADDLAPVALTWATFRARLSAGGDAPLILLAAFLIFAFVGVVFFSSFFTYWEGVAGAFRAYAFWTKTGTADHTQNGMWAYAKWLLKIESPIFLLAAVGALIALIKARHRFALFAAFWAFGLFLAYTIIPYKTPWLALSFILPMCIVAGYAINELAVSRDIAQRILAGIFSLAAVAVLAYQTYQLNFVRYDDDRMPYVYAHTERGFLDLISKIEHYAQKSGKGKNATIQIVSPDYWSMPWYTRDYPQANYHGKIVPSNTAEMIVAKKGEQEAEITSEYAAHYKVAGTYPLRPGVELLLLVRRDLADADAKELYDPALNDF